MAEMIYGQSNVGITVPPGRYLARFLGTEEREPFQNSKFGNEGSPRMGWLFEVADGVKKGEKFAQESGIKPVPKSTCARMVAGLAGGQVAVGQRVDPQSFVGRVYAVKVAVNPQSDKGNLYVADIEPAGQAEATAAGTATAAPAGGPPPRKPAAGPSLKTDHSTYYMDTGGQEPEKVNVEGVRGHIFKTGTKAADLPLCRVGESEWKTAKDYGFDNPAFLGRHR